MQAVATGGGQATAVEQAKNDQGTSLPRSQNRLEIQVYTGAAAISPAFRIQAGASDRSGPGMDPRSNALAPLLHQVLLSSLWTPAMSLTNYAFLTCLAPRPHHQVTHLVPVNLLPLSI